MAGLTRRAGHGHFLHATTIVALVVLATTACTAPSEPTLADVGATQLAGQNGDALDDRCSTLPAPEGTVSVDCADSAGRSVTDIRIEAGSYTIVLLCETSGSYTLRSKHPADLFEDVRMDCPEDADPVVRRAFELEEATQASLESVPQTSGASVAFLVRQD